MDEEIAALARALRDADRAVAFTGAGISTESGIPDFRGDEGLWKEHDPQDLHISRFHRAPGRFWETWLALHDSVGDVEIAPNDGHRVLADLVADGLLEAVITQNGDGLHQDAGTPDDAVIELHGTFREGVCQGCGGRTPMDRIVERVRDGEVPPRCSGCEGLLKPGAVLFGEQLPMHALARSQDLARSSDAFLVVGSSLAVHPAASLPDQARRHGATLAIVNLEETPLDDVADVTIHGRAGEVLTALRKRL